MCSKIQSTTRCTKANYKIIINKMHMKPKWRFLPKLFVALIIANACHFLQKKADCVSILLFIR